MTIADNSAVQHFIAASSVPNSDASSNFGESLASFTHSVNQLGGGGARDVTSMDIDDSVVQGLDTVQVNNHDAICCGAVGGKEGKTMCIKRSCSTECHRLKCDHPFLPTIYLKKGQDKVHIEPHVIVAQDLSAAEHSAIMNGRFSVQTFAKLAHTRDMAAHKGVTLDEAQDLIKRKREVLKTPARSNRRVADDSSLEGFDRFLSIHQQFDEDDEGALSVDIAQERLAETKFQLGGSAGSDDVVESLIPHLLEIVRQLSQDRNLMDINRDHVKFLSKFTKEESARIEDSVNSLRVDVETLVSTIGEMGAMSHNPKASLCEAIDSLYGMLMKVGVTEACDKELTVVNSEEWTLYLQQVQKLFTGINGRLQQLESETSGANSSRPQAQSNGSQGMVSDVDRAWQAQVEEELRSLKEKVKFSKQAGSERGFAFESYYFPDMESFQSYLEEKEGSSVVPLSLFQSWPTLLHRIFKDLTGESRSLRELKAISDFDMRDHDAYSAEALAMQGMPFLFKGRDGKTVLSYTGLNTGGSKCRFRGCPSEKAFGKLSQHDGLRYKAEEALVRVQRNIREDIDTTCRSPEVKSLCLSMLIATVEFVKALFAYMTDTYEDLYLSFGNEANTWDFVCKCVEDVLTTEFSEARAIAPGMDFGDESFTIRMAWCSLKILGVQQKFMDVGIANHSTLSATYSRFLIKNSQTADVASLKKELEASRKQNAKLEEKLKDLEAKVKAATGAADKAAQAVRTLQNQAKGNRNNNNNNNNSGN